MKAVSAFGTNGPSVTSATGAYTISNLSALFYTVTPAKTGLAFSPTDQVVDLTSSTIAIDFSVAHSVSGNVSFNGTGFSGTTVTVDGFSATTGTNGNYTVNGVPWGTFAVVPSLSGYFFNPPSQNVPLGPNATNINFIAYTNGIYVSGQVTSGTNGVSGVTVSAGTNVTTTGANGYYSFTNLPGVFLVTPSNGAQVFNPQHQALTASAGLTNINFVQSVSNITTIVATCDEPSLVTALALGGLVEFGADGDLLLTNYLSITNNLVLDGTNHQVTLDGEGAMQIAAINSNVTFTLNNLTVSNGYVDSSAGAVYNNQGILNIYGCTFVGNFIRNDTTAYSQGGAVWNGGFLEVANSTFIGNENLNSLYFLPLGPDGGNAEGGAIYNSGTASIQNCLFSHNVCYGNVASFGGAIYNDSSLTMVNCTFYNNQCVTGVNSGNDIANETGGLLYLTNCTFQSSGDSVYAAGGAVIRASIFFGSQVSGTLTDAGFNLSSTSSFNSFTNITSQNGVTNLNLSSVLAYNGGPTMTFNLLPGSAAIDAITNGPYPPTDQRGFTRPYGKAADIGAVEYYPSNFTIMSLTRTKTNWNVQGYGLPLTTFQLQSSTNLTNWSAVQTNATGSNGLFSILDTSSNAPRRFYRTAVP